MDQEKNKDQFCGGAIILAGGDSKRLGRPKALLEFGDQTLIEMIISQLKGCFEELTLITDRPDLYRTLPVKITGDLLKQQEKSPLRGIHAGLSSSDRPWQFVVACDMPFLNLDFIRYMAAYAPGHDAVVPRVGNYFQPLHAFYSRTCIGIIEEQVKAGENKVIDFYRHLNIKYIGEEEINRFNSQQELFLNINTWKDYQKALHLMRDRIKTG